MRPISITAFRYAWMDSRIRYIGRGDRGHISASAAMLYRRCCCYQTETHRARATLLQQQTQYSRQLTSLRRTLWHRYTRICRKIKPQLSARDWRSEPVPAPVPVLTSTQGRSTKAVETTYVHAVYRKKETSNQIKSNLLKAEGPGGH